MLGWIEPGGNIVGRATVGRFHDSFGRFSKQSGDDAQVDYDGDGQCGEVGVQSSDGDDDLSRGSAGVVIDEEEQHGPATIIVELKYASGGDG